MNAKDLEWPEKPVDATIEVELDRLTTMPIAGLRVRYAELFRNDPPRAFGPDLLRRSIAHRIQEKAYGGLSRSVQRLLDQMTKAYAAKPGGRIVLPRRIKPGSVLVRQWKGKSHRVTVVVNGFSYDGKTFSNLSEIAVLITGTRWNGPRFFGLRTKPQESDEPGVPGRLNGAGRKGAGSVRSGGRLGVGSDYRKKKAGGLSALEDGRHGR
jgi:Protein of unknown function (DUF2924)